MVVKMDLFMLVLGIAFFVGFLELFYSEVKDIYKSKKFENKESEDK